MFFNDYLDQFVALERSTMATNRIDIKSFLDDNPNYRSTYEAWERLEKVFEVKPMTDSNSNEDEDFRSIRKKYRRHVGPHDAGGLQRTISTGQTLKRFIDRSKQTNLSDVLGTLAPSFELNSKSTVDLVFATYWIQSDTSTLLQADERACIEEGMSNEYERFRSDNGSFLKSMKSFFFFFYSIMSMFYD